MEKVTKAVLVATLGIALASCSDSPPEDAWIVTQIHHYPAHTKVHETGECPGLIGDPRSIQTNCHREETKYPELQEVCAMKHNGRESCWYIPLNNNFVFTNQHVGQEVDSFESYIFTNEHPKPTNEWDASK